jgi:hypothetical protein
VPGRTPAPASAPRPGVAWSRLVVAGALGAGLAAAVAWFALRSGNASPGSATSPPGLPAEIEIKFVSAPPGATVRMAGTAEPLGTTPFSQRFPRNARTVSFEFVRPGFAPVTQDITLASDDALAVALTPTAEPPLPTAEPPLPTAEPPLPTAEPPLPTAEPVRKRPPAKRPSPPARERPLDRNGTLDVFENK